MKLPENKVVNGFSSGMVKAWEVYGQPRSVVIHERKKSII